MENYGRENGRLHGMRGFLEDTFVGRLTYRGRQVAVGSIQFARKIRPFLNSSVYKRMKYDHHI